MQQKMATALRRAELYSLMYKYGMNIRKDKRGNTTFNQDVGRGAAAGAAVGGGLGAAQAANFVSHTPIKAPQIKELAKTTANGRVINDLGAIAGQAKQLEAAKPQTFLPRIRAVIQQHGLPKVIGVVGLGGLISALGGAGVGALAGSAVHGARHRDKANV